MLFISLRRAAAAAVFGGSACCRAFTSQQPAVTKPAVPDPTPPRELFSVRGRVALITGASRGLGKACARGLALAGSDVVIVGRNETELRTSLREIIDGTDVKGDFVVCDLSDPGQVAQLGPEVLRRTGRVDIFINNAGVSKPECIHGTPLTERLAPLSDSGWQTTLQTNLSAGVALTNALAPSMVAAGWGRIVHISSIGGLGSSEGRTSYTASKAALIGDARTAGPASRKHAHRLRWCPRRCARSAGITHTGAIELGPCGVTVNCICPGPFLTDMPRKAFSPEQLAGAARKVPLQRWAEPHELVGPLLMLCSEAGSFVNGAVLRVDGGMLSRAY